MARSLSVRLASIDDELDDIEAWYRERLANTLPPKQQLWTPVCIGPTWQYDSLNGWVLPEFSLGWRVLAWCGLWLRDNKGQQWQFTPEQARFILWFYAVNEHGRFIYPKAVLQRLKGWGKDPLLACLSMASMFAPVTFDHWDGDTPIGREEPEAWVQLVAVSLLQTQNTMKLFPSLISMEARRHYSIQVGKLNVWGLGDTRQIQAVTASPLTIEGGRPTFVGKNETQNWNTSNGGHEMKGAIDGNVSKAEMGVARILDICNAYRPGENSVGQLTREAWEKTQERDGVSPRTRPFGLLYDSLEADPAAPLTVEDAPAVVESIRGDALWLSTETILESILDPTNPPSESRRKWYNQITAVADAWADPLKIAQCVQPGEHIVEGEPVVMFGDGSKSDDATGLVACRMSDGFCQVLHVQQPSKGEIVDRQALDIAVVHAMNKYKVQAFWFDPSHAKDDNAEGDNRFWWPLCDEWTQRYGKRLKLWPTRTGDSRHAVAFDMLLPSSQAKFVPAAEQLAADIESGEFKCSDSPVLVSHLGNARRRPDSRYGVSLGKEHRESARKIDLAVCAVGARMLWRMVKLTRPSSPGRGRIIVLE